MPIQIRIKINCTNIFKKNFRSWLMMEKYNQEKNCFHDDGKIHREKIAWMMIEKYIKQKKKCILQRLNRSRMYWINDLRTISSAI